MSFTFHARYALLTYAQCDGLDPWAVLDHFTSLEAECIIARENHADGGTHLHVFADFGKKRKHRRADIFDVSGHHPNIEPSRGTPERGYDYVIKDGDVVCGGLGRPGQEKRNGSSDHAMAEILACDDEQSFWETVREMAPGMLLRNFPSLRQYVAWRYKPNETQYSTPRGVHFSTEGVPELGEWAAANIRGTEPGVDGR